MRVSRFGACALLALLAGCQDPLTEVLLVMTSDLSIPTDVQFASVSAVPSGTPPSADFGSFFNAVGQFPLSFGVQASESQVFSASIRLFRTADTRQVAISRNISAVRFVPGELRMLVVPMKGACACQGTNCPLPGSNPDCDDLESPETAPLDPKIAPPSMDPSQFGFGGGRPL